MVPSMLNQVTLEVSNTPATVANATTTTISSSNNESSHLLAENEKVQDDLAYKLRNLIANFCDEHFVKYLKDNSSKLPKPLAKEATTTIIEETQQEEEKEANDCTQAKVPREQAGEKIESETPEGEMKEAEDDECQLMTTELAEKKVPVISNKESVDSDLNLTSSSSLTPPRSSYSSTSSSSSSSSSSPSSDINGHHHDEHKKPADLDTNQTSATSTNTTTTPTTTTSAKPEAENIILDNDNACDDDAMDTTTTSAKQANSSNTNLNEVIDKLEIIDHASKSIKEIAACAELNQHRLHHMDPTKTSTSNDDDPSLQSSTAALEKLWSQILIGADKLEIFGSIHVRSNNVRLFSCLIDEQLHIDNQSFSSASSCVSQDSCSYPSQLSTSLLKAHGHRAAKLRAKNLYKYERQMAQHTNMAHMYRKKMQHEMQRNQQQARFVEADFVYDMDRFKQAKLAKKVEDLAKAKELNVSDMDYPMKKFKAYHSFKKNNEKLQQQQQQQQQDASEVTSLSNLATVAAAAMRLNSEATAPTPVKKSRKPSVTTAVKPVVVNKEINNNLDTTELEMDDEDDLNNSLIIDQANNNSGDKTVANKLNDFYGLYDEEEEDFEDTSSVLSGSSFASEANLNGVVVIDSRKHRRHHSAHSRCSSLLSESLDGDCHLSRSVSVNDAANVNKRNSVSPALSLADSSSFDYDDEQVYQSYCSTSSFKSDFEEEDEYGSEVKKKKQSRKSGNDEAMMVRKSMNVAMNESGRHYHRRKQHLIEAEMKRQQEEGGEMVVEKMEFKTEKEQSQTIVQQLSQQTQLKLQQLPKLLGLQQQQHAELQQQQEEARKNRNDTDDYLARKYKYNRRFTPYNNNNSSSINASTGQPGAVASSQPQPQQAQQSVFQPSEENAASNNLYLLASSRHHHRLHSSADPATNPPTGLANSSSKIMSVNSLVDRLSPISDPDMERNGPSASSSRRTGDELQKLHHLGHLNHHIHHANTHLHHHSNPNEIHILNRINNLSPSSSSSSSNSSSNKNKNNQANNGSSSNNNNSQLNQLFHHQQQQAAAALAAVASGNSSQSSHSTSTGNNNSLNGHHAQSVAALLANMHHNDPQHQASSQDVAKALAASLNPHHHLNSHNHHTQQIINRFSSNPTQSELMAAVLAQQQQQHRSLMGEAGGQFALSHPNGPLYSRYSSHINAAVAAAAAAAASQSAQQAANGNGHNNRRAHSVESDAHTPSPPAITPANANGGSNGSGSSSLSSSSSSSSSTTSENYHSSKYNMHDRSDEMCKKERSSSVTPHSNDQNGGGNEKVRLVPGYDVYISNNDLNACNDDRGSATRLLRNLMDVFFDKSTLAKSSINGTGRITNTLDKHVISALFAYVKNRYQDVPHSQLTRAATDKCVQTRRNFRKKIKAAQSYFGMFPSIMIQRPPVPQGSD